MANDVGTFREFIDRAMVTNIAQTDVDLIEYLGPDGFQPAERGERVVLDHGADVVALPHERLHEVGGDETLRARDGDGGHVVVLSVIGHVSDSWTTRRRRGRR